MEVTASTSTPQPSNGVDQGGEKSSPEPAAETCDTGSFKSREEMLESMKAWSAAQGFAIVMARSRPNRIWLKCDRGGTYQNRRQLDDETRKRQRAESRLLGCPFRAIAAFKKPLQVWHVQTVEAQHNHGPSTDLTFHPSLRHMTPQQLDKVAEMQNEGRTPSETLLELRRLWPDIKIIARDVYNARTKRRLSRDSAMKIKQWRHAEQKEDSHATHDEGSDAAINVPSKRTSISDALPTQEQWTFIHEPDRKNPALKKPRNGNCASTSGRTLSSKVRAKSVTDLSNPLSPPGPVLEAGVSTETMRDDIEPSPRSADSGRFEKHSSLALPTSADDVPEQEGVKESDKSKISADECHIEDHQSHESEAQKVPSASTEKTDMLQDPATLDRKGILGHAENLFTLFPGDSNQISHPDISSESTIQPP